MILDKTRIGVCIDTQHTFAGGFTKKDDFTTPLIKDFNEIIGAQYLKGLHINNSLTEHGSHVDRHAPLLNGKIDIKEIRNIASMRLKVPYCLETTNMSIWDKEIELLK